MPGPVRLASANKSLRLTVVPLTRTTTSAGPGSGMGISPSWTLLSRSPYPTCTAARIIVQPPPRLLQHSSVHRRLQLAPRRTNDRTHLVGFAHEPDLDERLHLGGCRRKACRRLEPRHRSELECR